MRTSVIIPFMMIAATTTAFAENKTVSVQNADMLSTNVVGLDVYDGQKNDVGKIQDIVWGDGKTLKGYILSVGGFLGMGTHYVAVDPSVVNVRYDANSRKWAAQTTATKDDLKAAPEFKYEGQWDASKS
jgi:PRC-barrel domain